MRDLCADYAHSRLQQLSAKELATVKVRQRVLWVCARACLCVCVRPLACVRACVRVCVCERGKERARAFRVSTALLVKVLHVGGRGH